MRWNFPWLESPVIYPVVNRKELETENAKLGQGGASEHLCATFRTRRRESRGLAAGAAVAVLLDPAALPDPAVLLDPILLGEGRASSWQP